VARKMQLQRANAPSYRSSTMMSRARIVPDLLRSLALAARAFSRRKSSLVSDCVNQSRCLILDVKMPACPARLCNGN